MGIAMALADKMAASAHRAVDAEFARLCHCHIRYAGSYRVVWAALTVAAVSGGVAIVFGAVPGSLVHSCWLWGG